MMEDKEGMSFVRNDSFCPHEVDGCYVKWEEENWETKKMFRYSVDVLLSHDINLLHHYKDHKLVYMEEFYDKWLFYNPVGGNIETEII